MKTTRSAFALATVALALLAGGADARPLNRHRHRVAVRHVHGHAVAAAASPRYSHAGQSYDGQIIDQAAMRAQSEPGLTSEIEPSARQTATGGPAGGVPNHSDGP